MSIALHSAELAAQTYLAGEMERSFKRGSRVTCAARCSWRPASHALVRRPGQAALSLAARLAPRLVAAVAAHTRVSDAALARTSLELAPRTLLP